MRLGIISLRGVVSALRFALLVPCLLPLTSDRVFAADLAHLHNGFAIRHDHRQVVGNNTRLFLEAGDASYIDVPTAEIDKFEKDLSTPIIQPTPAKAVTGAANLDVVINSASATYHL